MKKILKIISLALAATFSVIFISADTDSKLLTVAEAKAPKGGSKKVSKLPERLTYEQAMELEEKRHQKQLRDIWKYYRLHKIYRKMEIQKENAFHAKRVEEIKKKYGMI